MKKPAARSDKSLDMASNRIVGEVTRRLMDRDKLTQRQMADQIGVSQGLVNDVMSKNRGAGIKYLAGLARLDGLDTVALLLHVHPDHPDTADWRRRRWDHTQLQVALAQLGPIAAKRTVMYALILDRLWDERAAVDVETWFLMLRTFNSAHREIELPDPLEPEQSAGVQESAVRTKAGVGGKRRRKAS